MVQPAEVQLHTASQGATLICRYDPKPSVGLSYLNDGISDRELEVLCLFGKGQMPSEIARNLNLSIKTVSTYRARLLEKLRLKTSAQLIRYAVMHQLFG